MDMFIDAMIVTWLAIMIVSGVAWVVTNVFNKGE